MVRCPRCSKPGDGVAIPGGIVVMVECKRCGTVPTRVDRSVRIIDIHGSRLTRLASAITDVKTFHQKARDIELASSTRVVVTEQSLIPVLDMHFPADIQLDTIEVETCAVKDLTGMNVLAAIFEHDLAQDMREAIERRVVSRFGDVEGFAQ